MTNQKNKRVGLIIKDRSLSAVEVAMGKNGPAVINYSKILLKEGIVENGCVIINKESFQEAVKKLLANGAGGPIKTNQLLVSIPEEKVFSHLIDIPKNKINDTDFIKEAAHDFIPIELNKAVFDYKIIHENDNKKNVTLSFVAVQNNIAEPIIEALKEIGVDTMGMNVDVNCIIRSFHNSLNKTEGDYLLLNLNLDGYLLAVNPMNDGVTKIMFKEEEKEMLDKIKALLNLSSEEEVQEFLIKSKQKEGLSEEQRASIMNSFKPYLDSLSLKIRQLISAAEVQEPVKLNTIYLTGMLAGLPGIEETITSLLPEISIVKSVKYTEIPQEIETDALEGIGLCMDDSLPNDKNYFNLLPQKNKDEVNLGKICPKLKLLSVLMTVVFMIVGVQMSLVTARNYLKYRITSQEVLIYNDQALNPYVTQVAKIKQQTKQRNEQILSLIYDSLPVSYIIQDLDSYNMNGVTMVNINYKDVTSLNAPDISVRAKTFNRTETEKFIESLNSNPLYTEVESPLSNLVGKGERFISVGLKIDKTGIIETYNKQPSKDTSETPLPATKPIDNENIPNE